MVNVKSQGFEREVSKKVGKINYGQGVLASGQLHVRSVDGGPCSPPVSLSIPATGGGRTCGRVQRIGGSPVIELEGESSGYIFISVKMSVQEVVERVLATRRRIEALLEILV